MKIVYKDIDKFGAGTITVITESLEDMWHAYNLITTGDRVRASTFRKVTKESATGSTEKERKRITVTIEVKAIDFDANSGIIRLNGQNVEENQFIKTGAFQSMDLDQGHKFSLVKDSWDAVSLDRLNEAVAGSIRARSDVVCVLLGPGTVNICLVHESLTLVKAHLNIPIPRKRKASALAHDKAMDKFLQQSYELMVRTLGTDWTHIKAVIIASPGFLKEQFQQHVLKEATRRESDKWVLEHKHKFILASASSGHKQALREVLLDKNVQQILTDTKAHNEVKQLQKFYDTMRKDANKVVYGYKHVHYALTVHNALETLMVLDSLFRATELNTRKRYVQLVELAREAGAEVVLFSAMHVTGEQLGQLSGVAATLRFPIMDLDEQLDDEDEAPAAPDEHVVDEDSAGEPQEMDEHVEDSEGEDI